MSAKYLWVWLIAMSVVTVIAVSGIAPTQQNSIDQSIGQWLGQIIGILLLPAIYYFLRKPKNTGSTDNFYLPHSLVRSLFILTVIVCVANLYVAYNDGKRAKNSSVVWTKDSCEFQVTFPMKPNSTHSKLQAKRGGDLGELHGAEITSDGIFYRSECIAVENELLNDIDDESIYAHLENAADRLGMTLRDYNHQVFNEYLVGSVEGTKIIDGAERVLKVKNFIGETSILTLYVMSQPEKSSSIDVRNFTESPTLKRL